MIQLLFSSSLSIGIIIAMIIISWVGLLQVAPWWEAIAYTISVANFMLLPPCWRLIWRMPLLSSLLATRIFPDLTGSWKVKISWQDMKDGAHDEVEGHAKIVFGMFSIAIEINTDGKNSGSESMVLACLPQKTSTGDNQLVYVYWNDPKNKPNTKSRSQIGAAILKISEDFQKMEGGYFTDSQTKGIITLIRT